MIKIKYDFIVKNTGIAGTGWNRKIVCVSALVCVCVYLYQNIHKNTSLWHYNLFSSVKNPGQNH